MADRLADGQGIRAALRVLPAGRRTQIRALLERLGTAHQCLPVLSAIAAAQAQNSSIQTVWTMPGSLAQVGRLTSSTVRLIEGARRSVTCSTFNFQRSSGLWKALAEAADRPGLSMRVYLDAVAADGTASRTPTAGEVAEHLSPGIVMRTKSFDGARVRNHAKFVVVDHRFVLVTSANLSWSAEYGNIELGLRCDDPALAESIERELLEVEDQLYERVTTARPRAALPAAPTVTDR